MLVCVDTHVMLKGSAKDATDQVSDQVKAVLTCPAECAVE
jgi:hypothetical protein